MTKNVHTLEHYLEEIDDRMMNYVAPSVLRKDMRKLIAALRVSYYELERFGGGMKQHPANLSTKKILKLFE